MSGQRRTFKRDLPEIRKQELIQATAQCLAERGYAETTVRAIAAIAGVSPGLIAHHFTGIDEMIVETYRHVGERVDRSLVQAIEAASPEPLEKLRAFLRASFEAPMLDGDLLGIWLSFWSLVRRNPEIHAVHGEVYASYRRRLENLFREIGHGRKLLMEPGMAALGLTAMLDGLWLELCLDPTTFSTDEALRLANAWVDALIGSAKPRAATSAVRSGRPSDKDRKPAR